MGPLGAPELIIIAVVLLVLFGASRLPATAKGIGQAMKIFKKEMRDEDKDDDTKAESSGSTSGSTSKPTPEITAQRSDAPASSVTEETQRAERQQ